MRTERAQISKSGRLVVPVAYRKAMGIQGGESLTLSLDEHGLHIQTQRQAIEHAQAVVRELFGPGRSLSEELIAERRLEAERERVDD